MYNHYKNVGEEVLSFVRYRFLKSFFYSIDIMYVAPSIITQAKPVIDFNVFLVLHNQLKC